MDECSCLDLPHVSLVRCREADGLVDQQRRAEAATKSALGAVATCKAKLNVHLQTQDPITRQGRK